MVMPGGRPGQSSQVPESLLKMLGMPSPEKILGEMQRLNNNLEILQPDIHLLAQAMQGITVADIRNLTAAMSNMKPGDMLRMLNEFTNLGNQIYDKLWGKK